MKLFYLVISLILPMGQALAQESAPPWVMSVQVSSEKNPSDTAILTGVAADVATGSAGLGISEVARRWGMTAAQERSFLKANIRAYRNKVEELKFKLPRNPSQFPQYARDRGAADRGLTHYSNRLEEFEQNGGMSGRNVLYSTRHVGHALLLLGAADLAYRLGEVGMAVYQNPKNPTYAHAGAPHALWSLGSQIVTNRPDPRPQQTAEGEAIQKQLLGSSAKK